MIGVGRRNRLIATANPPPTAGPPQRRIAHRGAQGNTVGTPGPRSYCGSRSCGRWILLGAYLVGLACHGRSGFQPWVDGWLGEPTQLAPAAVCWAAVRRSGPRRTEVLLLAVAVSAYAAGGGDGEADPGANLARPSARSSSSTWTKSPC